MCASNSLIRLFPTIAWMGWGGRNIRVYSRGRSAIPTNAASLHPLAKVPLMECPVIIPKAARSVSIL